jgi:hypothetical protein
LVERLRPDLAWQSIWPRLDGPSLEAREVDLHFPLLRNNRGEGCHPSDLLCWLTVIWSGVLS